MATVGKSPSTKPSLRAAPRQAGRRKAFAMKFWTAVIMLVPAGAAGLFFLIAPAPSPERNSGPSPDPYRLGAIVSDNGSTRCVRGTFDNTTGSISEKQPSCETTTFVDQGGPPPAAGTMHTLNAISNSFRK